MAGGLLQNDSAVSVVSEAFRQHLVDYAQI